MERTLNTAGQQFLDFLGSFPKQTFESFFSNSSIRLGLGAGFQCDELALLFEATFRARLCNIAFNGLGGCRGQIKPERELHRIGLERDFVAARNAFYATGGWQSVPPLRRRLINSAFLTVSVRADRLAR